MSRTTSVLLLACLGACASTGAQPAPAWMAPSLTGFLPAAPADKDDAGAPDDTTLPLGVGFTLGPSSVMVGATLDFPVDKKITVGPSLQYAWDDDLSMYSLTGQIKYYLPVSDDKDKAAVLPYATMGVGVATVDKDGRSSDSGAVINAGIGLRYLTGDHYRLGSEARWNYLPDDLGGEHGYLSIELLQIVISF